MAYAEIEFRSAANLQKGAVVVRLSLDAIRRFTFYFKPDGTVSAFTPEGGPVRYPSWEEGLEYLERL